MLTHRASISTRDCSNFQGQAGDRHRFVGMRFMFCVVVVFISTFSFALCNIDLPIYSVKIKKDPIKASKVVLFSLETL